MKISVYDILNNEYAIFHNEGLQAYAILEEEIKNHRKTELSFEKIARCSSQFLNACIGKLYLVHSKTEVDSYLTYSGTNDILNLKIQEVIDNALNSKEYDSLLGNALS